MTTTMDTKTRGAGRRHRGWLRMVLWTSGILIILVMCMSLVLTSSMFLKSVVLPRVSKALQVDVTVSDGRIRPFSGILLRDLEVKGEGGEVLMTLGELRVRYEWQGILRGAWLIEEVVVESPLVLWIEGVDGSSNWGPVIERMIKESPEPDANGAEHEPLQFALRHLTITDATVRWLKKHEGDFEERIELSSARLILENLRSGSEGSLEWGGALSVDQNPPAPGHPASLRAGLTGEFKFELANDFTPQAVSGNTLLEVHRASGVFGDMKDLELASVVDWSVREIREISLLLVRAGSELGGMRIEGPYDAVKEEGQLDVVLWGLDRQFLNLVGAPWGVQFNETRFASTNKVEVTGVERAIVVRGQSEAAKLSFIRMGQATPETDLAAEYDFEVREDSAEISGLRINWTPTERAANRVEMSGRMEYGSADAISGHLRIAAEALDLTPLYDQFNQLARATNGTDATVTDSPPGIEDRLVTEPEPMQLPVREFVCEARIGRMWLREMEVTECIARMSIDGARRVVVSPARLRINGSPVEGELVLNVGTAGWEYDMDFKVDGLELGPLINEFYREWGGQADGYLTGHIQLRGAGITDASLQKNLAGQNHLALTNASVQTALLTNMLSFMEQNKNPYLRLAWRLMEPTSFPLKIVRPLLGNISSKLGLGDLTDLPVEALDVRVDISGGKIQINAGLYSSAFALNSGGEILMEGVLTNSLIRGWPVSLALARPLAQKIPYIGSKLPGEGDYVALPSLFRIEGTVGTPTASFDATAFAQWSARSLLEGQNVGGIDAGNVVRELGDFLGGRKSNARGQHETQQGASTNAPSPLNELLQRFNRRGE